MCVFVRTYMHVCNAELRKRLEREWGGGGGGGLDICFRC